MTATDELRRLLDERGVEWGNVRNDGSESDYLTEWQFDGIEGHAIATEWAVGQHLTVCIWHPMTPEQAISATLGSEDTYTREDVEGAFVSGYSLGCLPAGSDPTWDQNEQTIDEHMAEWGWVREEAATLGGGYQGFWTHDGTLHIELPKLPESILVCLPDKRDREVRSARVWQYTLGDVDATPTRQDVAGTCKDVAIEGEWFECSECGTVKQLIHPNYCPNCGRRCVG